MPALSKARVICLALLALLADTDCGDAPIEPVRPDAGDSADAGPEGAVGVSPAVEGPAGLEPVGPFGETGADACTPGDLPDRTVEAGEAFAPGGEVEAEIGSCAVPLYRGVASRGMRLEAVLTSADAETGLWLHRFETHEVNGGLEMAAGRASLRDGEARLEWFAPQTGEFGLAVEPREIPPGASFRLEVRCVGACDRAMTRFPIVLLHGMGGTDEFLDLVEYYNGVPEVMRKAGFDVFVTVVDPVTSSSERARQLEPQIEDILAQTGARRVNLIGHSQGGVDGRALVSELDFGDRVASLTTIATPHYGTPLADLLAGLLDDSALTEDLVDLVGDIYGRLLGRGDQAMSTALREMSVAYMTETFNPTHPNDPRVAYYSWAGHTCALLEVDCQREHDGEIVSAFLAPAYRALQLLGVPVSDGLVGLDSAQWGEFLGELPADHLDEIGLLIDLPNDPFDHVAFFLAEGRRLFDDGF